MYDPECFTAGWNMCLMPGFLKLFTEKHGRIDLLHHAVERVAHDLYLRAGSIGLAPPAFVTDPGPDLAALLPDVAVNLIPSRPDPLPGA